jgi:hypothetical protein
MKFLPGIAVGAASGSMGGVVASHNRGGQYFRRRATPVNPATAFQGAVRSALAGLSSGWRGLTEAKRTAWNEAAESTTTIDTLGSSVQLTGQQLYIRANQRLAIYDPGAMITLPPLSWEVEALTSAAITDSTIGMLNNFDPLEVTIAPTTFTNTSSRLVIRATPPLQPGIRFVQKYLRKLGIFTPTVGVADISAAWNSRFGSVVADQVVWVAASIMDVTNGQSSVELLMNAVAVP